MSLTVRSRFGSLVVAVAGGMYVLAALVLLVFHIRQSFGARGLTDLAVDLLLAASALGGLWLMRVGLRGLRAPLHLPLMRPA